MALAGLVEVLLDVIISCETNNRTDIRVIINIQLLASSSVNVSDTSVPKFLLHTPVLGEMQGVHVLVAKFPLQTETTTIADHVEAKLLKGS